jgi:hypothetical protein
MFVQLPLIHGSQTDRLLTRPHASEGTHDVRRDIVAIDHAEYSSHGQL